MNGFIYKIVNDINDKIYIGKTLTSIEKRFSEHKRESCRNQKKNRPLYNAMSKYGYNNFHIELVEEIPIEELSNREIYWINFYNSYENGYNATTGGDGKQLFDYGAIVEEYQSGKLIQEISEQFGCSPDTVRAALHLAKIDPKKNNIKKYQKGLIMKDKSGNILQSFESRKKAAEWIKENKYTKTNDIDHIITVIGRAANGKTKSSYGFFWENI